MCFSLPTRAEACRSVLAKKVGRGQNSTESGRRCSVRIYSGKLLTEESITYPRGRQGAGSPYIGFGAEDDLPAVVDRVGTTTSPEHLIGECEGPEAFRSIFKCFGAVWRGPKSSSCWNGASDCKGIRVPAKCLALHHRFREGDRRLHDTRKSDRRLHDTRKDRPSPGRSKRDVKEVYVSERLSETPT